EHAQAGEQVLRVDGADRGKQERAHAGEALTILERGQRPACGNETRRIRRALTEAVRRFQHLGDRGGRVAREREQLGGDDAEAVARGGGPRAARLLEQRTRGGWTPPRRCSAQNGGDGIRPRGGAI